MADVAIDKTALLAAVNLGQKIGAPVVTEDVHYAVIPNDCKIESLINLQYPHGIPPARRTAKVALRDSASFMRYYELFHDDRSRLFAEPSTATFLAVLDYHGIGDRAPEFLAHRASFQMLKSEQWKVWEASNQKVFGQTEFAEFIEDNMMDISTPSPAFMLDVARDLNAKNEVNFASSTRLQSGQVQLKYTEEIKAGVGAGNLEVPESFTLQIPVFYGEAPISIAVRLRFRIAQGKLTFHYKMNRPVEVLNDAFSRSVAAISEALKSDVLMGTPGQ